MSHSVTPSFDFDNLSDIYLSISYVFSEPFFEWSIYIYIFVFSCVNITELILTENLISVSVFMNNKNCKNEWIIKWLFLSTMRASCFVFQTYYHFQNILGNVPGLLDLIQVKLSMGYKNHHSNYKKKMNK